MDLNGCISLAQSYLQNSPLIVLGSGASIPYGLPSMDTLAGKICRDLSDIEDDGYGDFCAFLDAGIGLENALDASTLKEETQNRIREIVWDCVNKSDLDFFENREPLEHFAIAKLFSKAIQPTPNKISVVTTNYDRIAEYAADIIDASIVTGFEGSLIRKVALPSRNTSMKRIRARERTIEIWKVHGSLDWFISDEKQVVSFPLSSKIPKQHTPAIVPPGKDKYSTTHYEPFRTIIGCADEAFLRAGSYLCIGYGFNDEHIQPKLLNEITKGKPIVVLTKKMSESCRKHLIAAGASKFMVLESNENGKTVIHGNGWREIYDGNLWSVDEFLKIW